ncbi:type III-B CRISPR module RAMP protein Cmr1 [Calditrichota bacterium LG25]
MEKIAIILEVKTPLFVWKNKEFLEEINRVERNRRTGNNETIRYKKYLRKVEVSANSFKGVLRWWFRALSGYSENLLKFENDLFGSTENTSPFKLKINTIDTIINKWDEDFDKETRDRKYSYGLYQYSNGRGNYNGLQYFGYNFFTRSRKNKEIIESEYFAPGTKIELIFFAKDKEILNKILMVFWLLLQFGGIGSRSRRGFGNFKILNPMEVTLKSGEANFKFKNSYSNIKEYENTLKTNCKLLFSHFDFSSNVDNNKITNFKNFSLLLGEPITEHKSKQSSNNPFAEKLKAAGVVKPQQIDWLTFINFAGVTMQNFRALKEPDHSNVHDFNNLREIQRAAFGMPLEFRFSQRGPNRIDSISIAPIDNNDFGRLASPIIISATEINNQLYVQYLILNFDYSSIQVKAKQTNNIRDIAIDSSILNAFVNFIKKPPNQFKEFKYQEIKI